MTWNIFSSEENIIRKQLSLYNDWNVSLSSSNMHLYAERTESTNVYDWHWSNDLIGSPFWISEMRQRQNWTSTSHAIKLAGCTGIVSGLTRESRRRFRLTWIRIGQRANRGYRSISHVLFHVRNRIFRPFDPCVVESAVDGDCGGEGRET